MLKVSLSPLPQSYDFDFKHSSNNDESDIFAAAMRARSETNVWTHTQSPTGVFIFDKE